jgi:excisionase family DNA binding protein
MMKPSGKGDERPPRTCPATENEIKAFEGLASSIYATEFTGRSTLTIEEAGMKVLGLSRDASYKAARNGELPTIRVGRRLLVPRAALEKLLASA